MDEIEKAKTAARMPYGATHPQLYFCGHCRARQVPEGETLCVPCSMMLDFRQAERKRRDGNASMTLTLLLAILVIGAAVYFLAPWFAQVKGGSPMATEGKATVGR
jgi:hypothetical protein